MWRSRMLLPAVKVKPVLQATVESIGSAGELRGPDSGGTAHRFTGTRWVAAALSRAVCQIRMLFHSLLAELLGIF
jgi:hypothetical protein